MSTKPLMGLKVLEFSHTIMGPCAGLILADLGADVVKVEPAPDGDHTRRLPGFGAGFFAGFNRNKRSIAINLKHPEGRATIHRLVKDADIVIENYAPGTMERLGCGYADLEAINPRLIYLALKGFLAGPYEHRPALDEVVQFQAGLAYMTGPAGRPLRAGASVNDITGAIFGVTAALAALRERDATGRGQRISSALFESAAFFMVTHMAGAVASGHPPKPMPERRHAWAIYDVFNASDDQIFIGVTSDKQWIRFTEEFGLAALGENPNLATNVMRASHRSWLIPAVQEALAPFSKAVIAERCERAAVSWAPVGKPTDLFNDPHLASHGGLIDVAIRTVEGTTEMTRLPAMPVEFGAERERPGLARQPPRLGEHTDEILIDAGFDQREIERLAREQVIAVTP
ncbi:CaiB/BaiF CoA transferase family protein [Bradyrhizobium iriomotense]|uniref:CoA transferase n=1 Tax=Bradyrhizobium iriomotense TaxID=441950 RepID=A0ABQ6B5R8_9BRAD|nr:CaiB/BaiF CoA-transferase family protein [Bradyrhizobium iriomotense]GLR89727.1 CoA transferase [Bradyrhizobium iriomotense]